MSYEKLGEVSLNYRPCRYGESRLLFRGPPRDLDGDYIAVLGGTDTYGKFIKAPYAQLIERELDMECVNFGLLNAGADAFLHDNTVIKAARNARVTVFQITGAQNNSNRLYKVHPRRNDRFVKPSKLMQQMFRELDFTEFHFTRHLLQAVRKLAPDRYGFLREELRQAWIARMTTLLPQIGGDIILLWFSDHMPEEDGDEHDPMFVTRDMVEKMRPLVSEVVEVVDTSATTFGVQEEPVLTEMETLAASCLLSPQAHEQAAKKLVLELQTVLEKQQRPA